MDDSLTDAGKQEEEIGASASPSGEDEQKKTLERDLERSFRVLEAALQLFDSDKEGERNNAFARAHREIRKINKIHGQLGLQPISFRQIFDQAAKAGAASDSEEELMTAIREFQIANNELKDNEQRLLAKVERLQAILESFKAKTAKELLADGTINPRIIQQASASVTAIETTMRTLAAMMPQLAQIATDSENPGAYPQILDYLLSGQIETLANAKANEHGIKGRLARFVGLPADQSDITILREIVKAQKQVIGLSLKSLAPAESLITQLESIMEALAFIKSGMDVVDRETHEKTIELLEQAETQNEQYRERMQGIEDLESEVESLERKKRSLEQLCEELASMKKWLEDEHGALRTLHAQMGELKKIIAQMERKGDSDTAALLDREREEHAHTRSILVRTAAELKEATAKLGGIQQRIPVWIANEHSLEKTMKRLRWAAGIKLTSIFTAATAVFSLGFASSALAVGFADTSTSMITVGALGAAAVGAGISLAASIKEDRNTKIALALIATVAFGIVGGIGAGFAELFKADHADGKPAFTETSMTHAEHTTVAARAGAQISGHLGRDIQLVIPQPS